CPQQIDNAAVFSENAIGEKREFRFEVLAGIASARCIRKHVRVGHDLVQALHLEPLMYKIAPQGHGARIGEHAPNLLLEYGLVTELAFESEVEQLLIRDRVPDEEGKLGREFDIINRVYFACAQPGGHVLAAVQEEGARQNTGDGTSDAGLE